MGLGRPHVAERVLVFPPLHHGVEVFSLDSAALAPPVREASPLDSPRQTHLCIGRLAPQQEPVLELDLQQGVHLQMPEQHSGRDQW